MSLLPSKVVNSATKINTQLNKYKDFEFDPTTNSFTGNIVEGDKALKGWIYFTLKIARYRYAIYSKDYGCELENIIGSQFEDEEYKEATIEHYIRDALLINPYIKSVDEIKASVEDEKVKVSCVVDTKYGVIYINVE